MSMIVKYKVYGKLKKTNRKTYLFILFCITSIEIRYALVVFCLAFMVLLLYDILLLLTQQLNSKKPSAVRRHV